MALEPTTDLAWAALPGAHWLHPQRSSRVPRRFVVLDTEAHRDRHGLEEVQSWRLGVSACIKWRPDSATWSPVAPVRHETPESLWETVGAFARKDARTVVVAHNSAYDVRISRALEILPAMGWTVTRLSLTARHITVDLTRDGRSLLLVDSHTVVPRSLADIAAWAGEAKPDLPGEDDPDEAWWERCEADVRVLAWAYMSVVDWLRSEDIGGWARTGSGMGWHTMLRRHLHHPVLVHGIEALHNLEGASSYAGRCEVWRHGRLTKGPYTEWDHELAYAGVMRSESLPTVYRDEVAGRSLAAMEAAGKTSSHLVEADVATDVPVLPWRDERGVLWPVGRFRGWWWHWELAEAVSAGAEVSVLRAHRYDAAPWLAEWADWVTSVVDDRSTPEACVRSAVAKHWQRSLVGRSAMRFKGWAETGPAWRPGLAYWPMVDADTGRRGAAVMLGDRCWQAWEEHWWDSALPQLLSAVMSHCRVNLWRAMAVAGHETVVYLDSDCLVTDPRGSQRLERAVRAGLLPGLRVKAAHPDLEPIAPQLVEGSTFRKLAGVPRKARRTGNLEYTSEHWEGIRSSLASGEPDKVRIGPLRQTLSALDWRRAHLEGGATRPYVVEGGVRELPAGATR